MEHSRLKFYRFNKKSSNSRFKINFLGNFIEKYYYTDVFIKSKYPTNCIKIIKTKKLNLINIKNKKIISAIKKTINIINF